MLPRYGALSQGWFYDFLCGLQRNGVLSLHEVSRCNDCWVYIFDDCGGGVIAISDELKRRMTSYEGLPLPDLELVHPINKYVIISLGVFSGDWQYNKLIEREV